MKKNTTFVKETNGICGVILPPTKTDGLRIVFVMDSDTVNAEILRFNMLYVLLLRSFLAVKLERLKHGGI